MPLTPGTRLGPYEIVAPLGAGGMGEVYRARDPRLGRDVAIKVLPQHLSANPEVRARFEREAKTVSSLNHPHICTLFDVGREGDTDYLVMELVEGETLAARIVRGAQPPAEVLRLGGQIADALDRAHKAGVIHRDLKPGNVMLTKAGAKLMDFGLARATGLAGPGTGSGVTAAALTQSPTMAAPLTAEGTIVGTFQYMAPEQLEGREADARSDLWALGCVLYEMATGKRAFEGATQASLISAIMRDVPRAMSELSPLAPAALERLVGALLAKDPEDRVQTAHDARLQLGWIAEAGPRSGVAPGVTGMGARAGRRGVFPMVAIAVGVVGLAALALVSYSALRRSSSTMVLQLPVPAKLRLSEIWSQHAISPDGASVVSSAILGNESDRLWLWKLDSPDPVSLPGTEEPSFPRWSPDSRSIVFFQPGERGLSRVPVSGGTPTRLCDAPWGRGVSWGSQGTIVFAPAASGPLFSIPSAGGTPVQVTALDTAARHVSHRYPSFLPDGEHFLFTALPAGPRGFEVFVGSLGSRTVKRVMEADCAPIFAAPGHLVFVQGGKVLAQRFDTRGLKLVGERFAIADASAASDLTGEAVASASNDGRLLHAVIGAADSRIEWLDRGGHPRGTLALPEGDWEMRTLSADGRLAAATRGKDLWRIDLDRSIATRLASGVRPGLSAVWSPDRRRLAMDRERRGVPRIELLDAGGSGVVDSIRTIEALFQQVADWSPDGRSLLVAAITAPEGGARETGWDLWTVPLDGGGMPKAYLRTPAFERFARISPDGAWIVCEALDRGQTMIFVDSYPVPGRRVQIAAGAIGWARWGRNSGELLYSNESGELVSVALRLVDGELHPGPPAPLFTLPAGLSGIDSRDGERFLVSRPGGASAGTSLRVVLGWPGLARR